MQISRRADAYWSGEPALEARALLEDLCAPRSRRRVRTWRDPKLGSVREHLAVCEARLEDLLSRPGDASGSGQTLSWEAATGANNGDTASIPARLSVVVERDSGEERVWQEPLFNDTDEKQWDNTWVLRLGGQYKLSKDWALRAGYIYDQSPVPEEYFETRVPDSDRQGISLGAGHTVGNLTIDVAYMYLKLKNRTVNNSTADDVAATPAAPEALDGNYKTTAQLAGITVGYKF